MVTPREAAVLPGILSKRVTLNVGTPRESTLLPVILSKRVKHLERLNVGTPRESILLPDIFLKRVKHIRNVECWHSQGVNFVTRHPLKACETPQIAWKFVVSPGSHLLGECAATRVSAHVR